MIAALVVGTLLAIGALAFVLHPLFFGVARTTDRISASTEPTAEGGAIAALREIEFDRATGKLSDTDYAQLKARYTREAVLAMRREEQSVEPGNPPTDAELDAAVLAYRASHPACPDCGPRPEPDAAYCSNCGRYLRDRCAECGAPVLASDARYCLNCGSRLAA
jgi:hypothetical protein